MSKAQRIAEVAAALEASMPAAVVRQLVRPAHTTASLLDEPPWVRSSRAKNKGTAGTGGGSGASGDAHMTPFEQLAASGFQAGNAVFQLPIIERKPRA